MLKNISQLEFKINDRLYVFQCPCDSPISDVKNALFDFIRYADQIEFVAKLAEENEKLEKSNEEAI